MNYNVKILRNLTSNCKTKNVFFYYDVLSPFSWLGFQVLQRYNVYWKDVDVILKPTLLGGIFKAINASPPVLSKIRYSRSDLERGAKYYDVPLQPVKSVGEIIAKGSMVPMRFLTAISIHQSSYLAEASKALWMRRYNKDQDISTPNDIRDVGRQLGMTEEIIESLLTAANSQKVKDALKKTTTEALDYGAFGVPTMVTEVDGKMELFFGADRIHILAQEIGEDWKGPIPPIRT